MPLPLKTWKKIQQSIKDELPVMLLYVLESTGSSPGRQGFFMAVTEDGQMEGSIGGGIMEHKFVEMAKEFLSGAAGETRTGHHQSIRKQVHDKSAARNQSGMICSGEQTIWIYMCQSPELPTIDRLIRSLEKNENGTLILSPAGIAFNENSPEKEFELRMNSAEDWLYKEQTGCKNRLTIIGGGHCALALSRLMKQMDFYITVYDDRPGLKTMEENEAVHEKHIVKDYSELKQQITREKNHYVVVMTFGYRTDDIAVRALLTNNFKYFGLLGSRKKIEKMFADYKAEGMDEAALQRIHAPIGLGIKSQTPEEIAVSIAAEIISIKNGIA